MTEREEAIDLIVAMFDLNDSEAKYLTDKFVDNGWLDIYATHLSEITMADQPQRYTVPVLDRLLRDVNDLKPEDVVVAIIERLAGEESQGHCLIRRYTNLNERRKFIHVGYTPDVYNEAEIKKVTSTPVEMAEGTYELRKITPVR